MNQAKIAVTTTVKDIDFIRFSIKENKHLTFVRNFQLQYRLVDKHWFAGILLRANVLSLTEFLVQVVGQDLFVKMPEFRTTWPVMILDARLVFTDLAFRFVHDAINGGIQVFVNIASFDMDVITGIYPLPE